MDAAERDRQMDDRNFNVTQVCQGRACIIFFGRALDCPYDRVAPMQDRKERWQDGDFAEADGGAFSVRSAKVRSERHEKRLHTTFTTKPKLASALKPDCRLLVRAARG